MTYPEQLTCAICKGLGVGLVLRYGKRYHVACMIRADQAKYARARARQRRTIRP